MDKLPALLYKYIFISIHYIVENIEFRLYNIYILNLTYDCLGQLVNLIDKLLRQISYIILYEYINGLNGMSKYFRDLRYGYKSLGNS